MNTKKTLVIGASRNPLSYSHKAVKRLVDHNVPVEAIGLRSTKIDDIEVVAEKKQFEDIHTVALYINPNLQKQYIDYIIGLKPQRIIFNPGTHNTDLEEKAQRNGIEVIYDCTLRMLGRNYY